MSRVLLYAEEKLRYRYDPQKFISRQVRPYQPSVRIGNWNEDLCLEEDVIKEFLHKKDTGQLSIQLSANLTEIYNCELPTSTTLDGYVHFGDNVMVKNLGTPEDVQVAMGINRRYDSTLALNAAAEEMQRVKKVNWPCGVSGNLKCSPTPRNTFTIVPTEIGTSDDRPVRYGEAFMLMPRAGDGLYLNLKPRTLSIFSKHARKHQVSLELEPTLNTHWKFLHKDPRLRFEYEGIPVPANEKLVINHLRTNECLSVEDQFSFRTAFGREYEVSGHTYKDTHKVETDVNHWIIVLGVPTDETPLIKSFVASKEMSEKLRAAEDRCLAEEERKRHGQQDTFVSGTPVYISLDSQASAVYGNSLSNCQTHTTKQPADMAIVVPGVIPPGQPLADGLTLETRKGVNNYFCSTTQCKEVPNGMSVMNEQIDPSVISANTFRQ